MGEPLVVTRAQVEAALDMPSLIDAMEAAFVAYSTGRAEPTDVIALEVPEAGGEIHVKAGYIHGGRHYAVKVASGFSAPDPPVVDGLVLVFDASDGALAALVHDHGLITDLRTGAAGGVAARLLAPERVRRVAVLGTGAQARHQLDALACVRPFEEVRIWGRRPVAAARLAEELAGRPGLPTGATFAAAETVEAALDDADVVVTCTASREPLVRAGWVKAGAHITALGSDGVGKQELDPEILRRADVLACDSRDQCLHLGELQHAPGEIARALELGAIATEPDLGRTADGQLTVCDLTGVGVQDVAAAELVVVRALGGATDG
jgi:ornithine cyclodeaminase/alanine dehydrogenase-like protein (mu-crystallin family)